MYMYVPEGRVVVVEVAVKYVFGEVEGEVVGGEGEVIGEREVPPETER